MLIPLLDLDQEPWHSPKQLGNYESTTEDN